MRRVVRGPQKPAGTLPERSLTFGISPTWITEPRGVRQDHPRSARRGTGAGRIPGDAASKSTTGCSQSTASSPQQLARDVRQRGHLGCMLRQPAAELLQVSEVAADRRSAGRPQQASAVHRFAASLSHGCSSLSRRNGFARNGSRSPCGRSSESQWSRSHYCSQPRGPRSPANDAQREIAGHASKSSS